MYRFLTATIVLATSLPWVGCGNKNEGLLRTPGRLMKGDASFIPEEGQYAQVIFYPILPGGRPYSKRYVADIDQTTGTFVPDGAMRTGMPPGKYRAVVYLRDKKKNDLFNGKFDEDRSTFVFNVDEKTEEIVIDLDNPPVAIAAPSPPPANYVNEG